MLVFSSWNLSKSLPLFLSFSFHFPFSLSFSSLCLFLSLSLFFLLFSLLSVFSLSVSSFLYHPLSSSSLPHTLSCVQETCLFIPSNFCFNFSPILMMTFYSSIQFFFPWPSFRFWKVHNILLRVHNIFLRVHNILLRVHNIFLSSQYFSQKRNYLETRVSLTENFDPQKSFQFLQLPKKLFTRKG